MLIGLNSVVEVIVAVAVVIINSSRLELLECSIR